MGGTARNELHITAELIAREALRHTPTGMAVLELTLRHASEQVEGGLPRRVECELPVVAMAEAAQMLAAAPLGSRMHASGFLAARSLRSRQPVFHLTGFEFSEGKDDGIQTEEAPEQA